MSANTSVVVPERNWDSLQFRLIFALSFVVYLVAAIGSRFTLHYWRHAGVHRSIFAEAWEASGTTAQIAFHG